jgi:hypothetical protein
VLCTERIKHISYINICWNALDTICDRQ